MITERGCAGYDSRGRLTHSWRIFRVNGFPPSLSLCSWVGRQGRTVVYINGAFPPSCTLRIETLTHSPLHCAHAKPFVRCSLRRTTYVRNSRPPPASANSNNYERVETTNIINEALRPWKLQLTSQEGSRAEEGLLHICMGNCVPGKGPA